MSNSWMEISDVNVNMEAKLFSLRTDGSLLIGLYIICKLCLCCYPVPLSKVLFTVVMLVYVCFF